MSPRDDRHPPVAAARPGPAGALRCRDCGCPIEECAFCEGPACPEAICCRDLSLALGERTPALHAHGG
ncbi:MAG TPA: hypothetical protein VNO34_06330 [Actinomycetota bacterium]|nr:hypothetical protein [Actinomycetota bacterium]